MSLRSVWIIPFLTFAFSLLAFLVSYCIAVYYQHVNAFWPYISDSGAMSPESCVFGQLLNFGALFLGLTVYMRHRQIVEFYWHHLGQKGKWRIWSNVSLVLGLVCSLGISIVANFQEINVIIMHYFGAFLAFTCGLMYLWAQTLFSYLMTPRLTHRLMCHFRLLLSLLATAFYSSTVVFSVLARKDKDHMDPHCEGHLYIWSDKDANYKEHTTATISEWALAGCLQVYILTFSIELRHARCHAPKLKLNEGCPSLPESSGTTSSSTSSTSDGST